MIPKNIFIVNQLLLMMLFTAALFDPLVNADGKTFMISNDNRSAKAIVGTDKKIEVKLSLNPNDYNAEEDRKFDLSVGGCNLEVKASKDSQSGAISFNFYNGKASKSVDNPESFLVQDQTLSVKGSNGERNVNCNQGISFVSMDGKLTLEIKLDGSIPQNLVLTSNNLVYNNGSIDSNLVLYVCIGVGVLLLLLLVSGGVVIAAFYIKRRKQKAAAAKKSKEQLKTAVSAEKTKVSTAKELSEQKSSKKPALVKDVKPAKAAPRDQKQNLVSDLKNNLDIVPMKVKEDQSNAPRVAAEEEDPMEAKPQVVEEMPKPAIGAQPPQLETMPKPLLEAKPQVVEEKPMPAMEAQQPQLESMPKPSLETQPQLESIPKPAIEANPQVEAGPKPSLEMQQLQFESMPKPIMETQPPQVEEKPNPSLETQPPQVEEAKPTLETQSQVEEANPRRIRKKRSKSSKKSRSRKSSKRRKRSRKAPRWRLRKSHSELQEEERQREEARKNEKLKEEAESNSEMKRRWENDGLKTAEDDESAANQRAKEQDEK